jgi:microcystin-dependent protein
MAVRIQFRRGTSTEWSSANPVLAEGELGFESDTKVIKFGDGITAWDSLPVAAAGDITAVIAGTGLTGGATSGQATLGIDTSFVVTADSIDAPGDLIVGAGPDTYARLPVGANGSVLVADSTQSVGVRWAAASSSSGAVVPTGTILPFAGTALSGVELPGGFFLCDGQAISRSTYSALFTAIGTSYTTTTNPAQFNVPDLRGRVPAGFESGNANFGVLGGKVGRADTSLIGGAPAPNTNQVQLPGHAHSITFTGQGAHPHDQVTTGDQSQTHSHSVSLSGGKHKHTVNFFDIGGTGSGFGTGPIGLNGTGSLAGQTQDLDNHSHSGSSGNASQGHTHTLSIPSSGGHSHEANITNSLPAASTIPHVQPSLVVNYIIKT